MPQSPSQLIQTRSDAGRWRDHMISALAAEPDDPDDEEALDIRARDILTRERGEPPADAQVEKFTPLLIEAKTDPRCR